MGRTLNKLTAKQVEKTKAPGMYADGGGLYLRIASGGSRGWMFRYKRRDMGLGAFPAVSLAEARVKAAEARKLIGTGFDPLEQKKAAARKAVTFAAAARSYVKDHQSKFKSEKSLARWLRFERYAATAFGTRDVASVGTDDVLKLLKPL